MKSLILLCAFLAGCATMHKPGETVESKARDRYECEKDAFNSNAGMHANAMYRDCMRARGYQ